MALTQAVLKGSEGLLRAAISESGTFNLPYSESSLATAKAAGLKFLAALGCDASLPPAKLRQCIRSPPSSTVEEAAVKVGFGFDGIRSPVDGVLLTDSISELLVQKRLTNKVRKTALCAAKQCWCCTHRFL